MSDEASAENENTSESEGTNHPSPLPENPPAEKPSTPQSVKVDLGELRELLEGLPEKTAQFIKEAVSTPKRKNAPTAKNESSAENAPDNAQGSNAPKQSASGNAKRGWLARGLFGN